MIDPITFSIIRHRLFRVVDEAVITLKNVSGSAITNEGHDLMVSLYRADGSLLMGGVGFLHHLTSAAEACKSIIRRFAGDIHPGDVFLLNDPYTAALHTSDVYLVAPIHYQGELVAWSACFVHVYDIGATNPGGFCPDAENIYTEGFSSPGLRLVEQGEINEAVMDTFLNMVRSPDMVALDINSMIACNNVARARMLTLIEKYGFATVDETCRTLIVKSEEKLRARLRELPDGQWQSRQYLSVKDEIYRVELTMTKQDDSLTFDFSGSSEQSRYAINCTRWASLGGLFAPLFPLLCYDITWNEGVISPITMIAPEGTIVNCTRPAPVSVATVGAIQSVNNAACTTIGKLLSASEKYAPEATAVWHANHFAVFLFGQNQHHKQAIGILTETFAGAGGARAWADGIEVGGEIPNPISRMANVETVEYTFPIRYLYLRWNGGGGYGDPLARPPQDVAGDVRDGLTSREFAESVYGVVVDADTGEPDQALTQEKRAGLRQHRRNGAQTATSGNAQVNCKYCSVNPADSNGNWKESAVLQETPMQSLGGPYTSGGEVLLRSFSCPNCGVLLDTETAIQGDPYLNDRILIRR